MRWILRRFLLLSLLLSGTAFADVLRGTVKDAAGQPLANVRVSVEGAPAVFTRPDGAFELEVPSGEHLLRVSRPGFHAERRIARSAESIEIVLRPELAETMTVSGIRADETVPVTKSNIEREEIERRYHGQDIPLLLRDTPSVNAYTESGVGGSGYSYITLRGISPTRINFTLDAVPLADGEDMATYFADFPDLAQSLQSIQLQRGVGTSSFGSASFGGSVNFESIALEGERSLSARLTGGSFGTAQASVGYQSGELPGGYLFYSRLSYNQSDGYRRNSGIRQHNLFFSGAKRFGESELKLTGFTAHEKQELSFYATDRDTLEQDRRSNPLAPDERDSFSYDLGHLQYLRALSPTSALTASLYYQRGYGWYRLFDDSASRSGLRQYGLDGLFLGTVVTMSQSRGALTANYGFHVNRFRREHTRDLVGGARDYFNYGAKSEANGFAKFGWTRGRWNLFSDLQLRRTLFDYHGDIDIDSTSWTFFNPKAGARYAVSANTSVYGTVGLSTREPARNDFFHGEDNPTVSYDIDDVKPERLFDVETGLEYRRGNVSIAAALYAMEFRNEIAATGELSEIGLPLRRNVDRSHRRGVEVDAIWRMRRDLAGRLTANLSRNQIRTWPQFYDVYDPAGNYLTSKPLIHRDVEPLLTPETLITGAVDYRLLSIVDLSTTARYVSMSYLDNTNREDLKTPSFTVIDASVGLDLTRWIAAGNPRLKLQVNNLTDDRTVYPSGYSYPYITRETGGGESISGIAYYYPQAGRHFMAVLDLRM